MNANPILPDDHRLTAFALGELEGDERAAVAAAVRDDAGLCAVVREIQVTARRLETALATEPAIVADAEKMMGRNGHGAATVVGRGLASAAILPGNDPTKLDGGDYRHPRTRAKVLGFPQFYYLIGGLAAACFAVIVAINRDDHERRMEARRVAEQGARERTVLIALPVATEAPTTGSVAALGAGDGADNPFVAASAQPTSTFALGVDGSGYADVRRAIEQGVRPPRESVRIEELLNYFPYDYPAPTAANGQGDVPVFAAALEVADSPWMSAHRLVRIGLKSRDVVDASGAKQSVVVAKDVEVQVEFNPGAVASYRLIGYEDRPRRENGSGRGGAAEISAGHTVTALYEVVPAGADGAPGGPLLTVRLRFKKPGARGFAMMEFQARDTGGTFARASADFQFAAAVAQFGMILRDSPHRGVGTLGDVAAWAANAAKVAVFDPGYRRSEFVDLVRRTQPILR